MEAHAQLLMTPFRETPIHKSAVASVKAAIGQFVRDARHRYTSVPAPTVFELCDALFDDCPLKKDITEAACWVTLAV